MSSLALTWWLGAYALGIVLLLLAFGLRRTRDRIAGPVS